MIYYYLYRCLVKLYLESAILKFKQFPVKNKKKKWKGFDADESVQIACVSDVMGHSQKRGASSSRS